jgi:hypothetical protein
MIKTIDKRSLKQAVLAPFHATGARLPTQTLPTVQDETGGLRAMWNREICFRVFSPVSYLLYLRPLSSTLGAKGDICLSVSLDLFYMDVFTLATD